MARQLRIEYDGAFYHVTARGNERREIYRDDQDRNRFLEYLQTSHKRFGIKIHAYCLMDNHYHLLIETPRANISRCMQYINTAYTVYYNVRHNRTGHLFQGRYKAVLVEKDEYLLELSRYIHLNPVRAGIVRIPEQYQWSSYRYYKGDAHIPEFLEQETTTSYCKDRQGYLRFVQEGIGLDISNPDRRAVAGCVLGGEEFVNEIKEKYLDVEKRQEDLPGLKELSRKCINEKDIIGIIHRETKLSQKEKDKLIIYFMRKLTDKTLGEIAAGYYKGNSISGVNKIVQRLEEKSVRDHAWAKEIKRIEEKLSNVKV